MSDKLKLETTQDRLPFRIDGIDEKSHARACAFTTAHNEVLTPVFMPVATFAALRTQRTPDVQELGIPVLLANTYHLFLRPGLDVFRKCGGIHPFMQWKNSILTDSGGYQVFSLSPSVRLSEKGVYFKSYVDGKTILLDPETSIRAQRAIGSDIMMAMDVCLPSKSDETACKEAVETTAAWAEQSLLARGDSWRALFGIVQGGCFPRLRRTSAKQITSLPFDGYAIGGLAVGESDDERKEMTALTAALLPENKPRYLMGVGTPLDLLEAVHDGIDMFDCIIPTAFAQQGVAFTSNGVVALRRGVYKFSDKPIDEDCSCPACSHFSRSYLHHLVKTGEYFGGNLIGLHNLTFYRDLMAQVRRRIMEGGFRSFYEDQREKLAEGDKENPATPPRRKRRKNRSRLGSYEVVGQDGGIHSIRDITSGEIMHSVLDPFTEAKALYVEQSSLRSDITGDRNPEYFLWDVGLGGGANAMAALLEYENLRQEGRRLIKLNIISFEKDLDSFRLVLRNPGLFPYIRSNAPREFLRNGIWLSSDGMCRWMLLKGDFLTTMANAPVPDCIYYDPFSFFINPGMWSVRAFRKILDRCGGHPVKLFTYSSSVLARAALLAAGFHVSRGSSTGLQSQTTAAFFPLDISSGFPLLDKAWLERFKTSSAHSDFLKKEGCEAVQSVLDHPQFRDPGS
ncbi:MAG: tRNA guanosine(34) transglycosylase Tgt [Spirochaetales bacterium]|nr:tRNA guanosine(34) transglycosylase Tgt [Spirochaetales bacterium]